MDREDLSINNISDRYRTDFDEMRVFGKGGFGVVVAAVNRLDGRLYAIKKIKLMSTSLNAYTKIIREVATLARLQHPNVVRYFQAWLEPSTDADDLTSEDSMDLDVFLETDSSASQTALPETISFTNPSRLDPRPRVIPEEVSDDNSSSSFVSATSDTPRALVRASILCVLWQQRVFQMVSRRGHRSITDRPLWIFILNLDLDPEVLICMDHRKRKCSIKFCIFRWRHVIEHCTRRDAPTKHSAHHPSLWMFSC